MKVLIVGGGGREHAIAWKVAESPLVDKVYCAPGNAGIEEVAECVPIGAMEFDKLVAFAKEKAIDLTVIGMDDPLVGGIVDAFEAEGLRVFGPRKNAAIIEGSKAFSKDLMKKYGIPTATYENFTDPQAALDYLETAKMPIVLKADGLALGKGVLICQNLEEARAGVKEIMEDKKFGSAGNQMVVEEFMTGREVSALCFCDGTNIVPITSAQDHKRAKDGDQGLNTGGMGTFSPSPFYTEEVNAFCVEHIFKPTMAAMKAEGRPFKGVIFFPYLMNGVAVALIFQRFFRGDDGGTLNSIIALFGADPVKWLSNGAINNWCLVFASVWRYIGFDILMFIGAIQSISPDIYEAADLDGANAWQRFWRVTFPLILPAFNNAFVNSLIGGLKVFDIIVATTNGGPGVTTQVMNTMIYRSFSFNMQGEANAGYVLLAVIVALFAVSSYSIIRKREVDL